MRAPESAANQKTFRLFSRLKVERVCRMRSLALQNLLTRKPCVVSGKQFFAESCDAASPGQMADKRHFGFVSIARTVDAIGPAGRTLEEKTETMR